MPKFSIVYIQQKKKKKIIENIIKQKKKKQWSFSAIFFSETLHSLSTNLRKNVLCSPNSKQGKNNRCRVESQSLE